MSVYLFNSFFSVASLYESVKVSAKFKGWMSNGKWCDRLMQKKTQICEKPNCEKRQRIRRTSKPQKPRRNFHPNFVSLSLLISLFSFYLCYTHSLTFVFNHFSLCLFFFNVFFCLSPLTYVHYSFSMSIFPLYLMLLTLPTRMSRLISKCRLLLKWSWRHFWMKWILRYS